MATKVMMTVAEFDQLDHEEFRHELDEGELITMTRPRPLHNRVILKLTVEVALYLRTNPIGELLVSENMFVLGPDTRLAPDLSFLRAERAVRIDPTADIEGAPDLAVEVFSPTDTATRMRRKAKQYFAAGCQEVWLIYPETREVEVWLSSKDAHVVTEDELLHSSLLPGFSLRVS